MFIFSTSVLCVFPCLSLPSWGVCTSPFSLLGVLSQVVKLVLSGGFPYPAPALLSSHCYCAHISQSCTDIFAVSGEFFPWVLNSQPVSIFTVVPSAQEHVPSGTRLKTPGSPWVCVLFPRQGTPDISGLALASYLLPSKILIMKCQYCDHSAEVLSLFFIFSLRDLR